MESTLLVGDFVLVSKLPYGPRLPLTLGVPFTDLYWSGLVFPTVRLPGSGRILRGDLVVFNYPPEPGPIDRKAHYVKRVVGLPGDTVSLVDKRVVVNGATVERPSTGQQQWVVEKADRAVDLSPDRLRPLGVLLSKPLRDSLAVQVTATREVARLMQRLPGVVAVEPSLMPTTARAAHIFPPGSGFNRDHYGPVHVPQKGDTIELTPETWRWYGSVIARHEGNPDARLLASGTVLINGRPQARYRFRQDYYFVLGDNQDDSLDSRWWGFVPADHVVGRPILVYFSWDPVRGRPRMDRLLHRIR